MPAKTEYLSSRGQRWLKISAGILGGYFVAMLPQIAIGAHLENKAPLLITSAYLSFFLWVFFMIVPFLFRSGWKVWGVYLLIIASCSGIIYIGIT